jgi:hypothetical protein
VHSVWPSDAKSGTAKHLQVGLAYAEVTQVLCLTLQAAHREHEAQREAKLTSAADVHEMYDLLAFYGPAVPTGDQVQESALSSIEHDGDLGRRCKP